MMALALAAALAPPAVVRALQEAQPGARVEITSYRGSACAADSAELRTPFTGTGAVTLRIAGPGCAGWALVDARLVAQVLVAARDAKPGEEIAAEPGWREVRIGHEAMRELPAHSVAARRLVRGQVLEADAIRAQGPQPGQPIRVVLAAGALSLTETGRALPCANGRGCALLPSGKRVEGPLRDGALFVEAP